MSSVGLLLRRVGRPLKLNRAIAAVIRPNDYELKFQELMLATVLPDDVVWDVGANLGLYCELFSAAVGSGGAVIAFEPSPGNRERLEQAVAPLANVRVIPAALGEHTRPAYLTQGSDALGATSSLNSTAGPDSITVGQHSGDDVVSRGTAPLPHVIKIDVEGSELEVLKGMSRVLCAARLRAICVEVHFGLLLERGVPDAPSQIERLLKDTG